MSESDDRLVRASAPALDEVLGRRFPVLDDGFVRAVDYMGADESIVQAARVSYGRGTKQVSEDRSLIRYLLRNAHTSPLEMCELKLHVRVPMDCWRQWIRHRTASVNEYSTRYSLAITSAQKTAPDQWRSQSKDNKQGSGAPLAGEIGEELSREEAELIEWSQQVYEHRIAEGVAREQARKDLPLSTYTEAYWKIDLHNLLRFLELRMSSHAQLEIRSYATLIGEELVKRWVPLVWEAFVDYRLQAFALSRAEIAVVHALSRSPEEGRRAAAEQGFLEPDGTRPRKRRELDELEAKLARLGIAAPW
ncbi:MAG: FAD-dependent thymidylate synthase [Deltaproteobacteria bacterium]|nr:FAD-dependent thymidylate synthase [Deltaproteobacteria bacterium]